MYDKEHLDLELVRHDNKQFVINKEAEFALLKELLADIRTKYEAMQAVGQLEQLYNSQIVSDFRRMAIPTLEKQSPTDEQWDELEAAVKQHNKPLYSMVSAKGLLSQQEFRVTILASLGIPVGDIANLLGTTPPSIANSRKKANKKLFHEATAQTFNDNLMKIK